MERITSISLRTSSLRLCAMPGISRVTGGAARRNICGNASRNTIRNFSPRKLRTSSLTTTTYTTSISTRLYSSSPLGTIANGADDPTPSIQNIVAAPDHLNENETAIYEMLMRELQCTRLDVKDISGGCGSMYGIEVESERFRGLNMLKQQRMVNQVLKEKMDSEGWHGVQLRTAVPTK